MPEPARTYHGLAAILLDAGVVTAEQIERGLERHRETGLRIGETLVEIGAATEEDIGWALARQLGLPLVDLQSDTLDPDLIRAFPAGLLYRLHAVPLLRSEEGLSIAFSDPTDAAANLHLESIAGCPILASVTTPSAVRRVLAPLLGAHVATNPARSLLVTPAGPGTVVWERSGADFLHFHVHSAVRAGASAVHFVPSPGGVRVFQRRPEGIVSVASEPTESYEALLTQLELLGAPVGDLERDLHRLAQVTLEMPGGALSLGVALLLHAGATHVTLRLPAAQGVPASLDALGLDPVDLACVREVLHRPAGLVLVSGPVGSGCSTTLACLLAEALRDDRSAMVFGSRLALPAPERVVLALPERAARNAWEAIVTEHTPDVVVLDDVASGEDLAALTSAAGMGRLVIARVDWGDTFALLEQITSRPHGRAAAASRLHLVIQQRLLPPAPVADGAAPRPRARFETLVISQAMRAALRGSATADRLRQLAQAEGFLDLAARLDNEVRSGQLDAAAAARAIAS